VDIPIDLPPFGSIFVVFRPGSSGPHAIESNLNRIAELNGSEVKGVASSNGEVQIKIADGDSSRKAKMIVSGIPEPIELKNDWNLSMEGYRFTKLERQIRELKSWTEDPATAHFSGTGRYRTTFEVPIDFAEPEMEVTLDLGKVGDVAEVSVNDHPVGVAWMQPYTINVTSAIKPGLNQLEILVTNTLINYVSGLDRLPDVPEELTAHYGTSADTYRTGTMIWETREKGFRPLPLSGLLGPVMIIPRRKVTLHMNPM
jgi:hypothetical protein